MLSFPHILLKRLLRALVAIPTINREKFYSTIACLNVFTCNYLLNKKETMNSTIQIQPFHSASRPLNFYALSKTNEIVTVEKIV